MASSVFERTRALHADVEDIKEKLLDTINQPAHTSKDRILLDHELQHQLEELRTCQATLLQLYTDADGARAAELRSMTGGATTVAGGTNESLWTTFYDSLSQIRAYHAKFPNAGRSTAAKAAAKDASSAAAGAEDDQEADPLDLLVQPARGVHFSAEECFGERVDMHALFERFVNLPHFASTAAAPAAAQPAPPAAAAADGSTVAAVSATPVSSAPSRPSLDYLSFLSSLPSLHTLAPRDKKLKVQPHEYRRFIQSILDYMLDFHKRIQPLVDVEALRKMVQEDFVARWEKKDVPGWFDDQSAAAAAAAAAEQEPGSVAAAAAASSSDASAAPAAAASSSADASNPLYCVACSKLFAKQSVYDAHLPGKKHAKNEEIRRALQGGGSGAPGAAEGAAAAAAADGAGKEGAPNSSSVSKLASDIRSLAMLESEVVAFAGLLGPQLKATTDHLVKKATRTYEEIAAEMAAVEAEVLKARQALKGGAHPGADDAEDEDEEEDANAPLYNPLNLPLGFDGKPIPYWLYKLHGLNLKFNCEICGDYSYAGPRNFERHFTEWRHAYGMRALGIPNTKHFAHITRMADAQALFEKLKREGVGAGFKPEEEEECEDADGNVFNKRTFLELQKQGLV